MGADREDGGDWSLDVVELCPEVCSPLRTWYHKHAAARVKAAIKILAWRPSEEMTLVVFVLLTLAGIRWMWTHPTELRTGVELVQRLPRTLDSHLQYGRMYYGAPLTDNAEPPFPFSFTIHDAEDEWLPQIQSDLNVYRKYRAAHREVIEPGHPRSTLDDIVSLVNRTSGIAPCAVRMVYIFKSQVYYDDRAAPLCNHQDENQRSAIANLPLLDRHLRSVIRWASRKRQVLPNVRFVVSTSEFGVGHQLFNNSTLTGIAEETAQEIEEMENLTWGLSHRAETKKLQHKGRGLLHREYALEAKAIKHKLQEFRKRGASDEQLDLKLFAKFPVLVFAKQGGMPMSLREGEFDSANPQVAAYQAKVHDQLPAWSVRNTRGVLAPSIGVGDLDSYERNLKTVRAVASDNDFGLRKPMAYWRGRCSSDRVASWPRIQVVGLSKVFPFALDAAMTATCDLSVETEVGLEGQQAVMVKQLRTDTHRTLLTMSQYKYLLDMPSSLSNCSFTNGGLWGHGSAVLRWNTDCQQWFHPKIREAEHYLSVDADNLISRIDYLADHEAEANALAEAGEAMFRKYLSPDSIVAYWILLLAEYQKFGEDEEVTEYNGEQPLPKYVCTCERGAVPPRPKCSFCEHWMKEKVKSHEAVSAYMFHHGYT